MIETDPMTFIGILYYGEELDAAEAAGALRIEGDRDAVAKLAEPLRASRPGRAGAGDRMTGAHELAIEAEGLVKSFGDTKAVDGVDLSVRKGAVYGMLGPNGAGKTTTIRMLATLLRPDAGSARVLGHDIVTEADAVRGVVSLTGQLASVDEDLTGRENLILIGRLLGLSRASAKARADELLDAFGLVEASARLVKNYSGGMRRQARPRRQHRRHA